jgi:hypothetical protein
MFCDEESRNHEWYINDQKVKDNIRLQDTWSLKQDHLFILINDISFESFKPSMANAQLQALQYVQNKFDRESLVLWGH